jgi:hypothetical protein
MFLRDTLIVLGLVAFNYFVTPFIFPISFALSLFFSILISVTNVSAILLSWSYFSNSRCYPDEANPLTMVSYKLVGASSTHLVVFVIRVATNVVSVIYMLQYPMLFTLPVILLGLMFKPFLLTISITASLYTYEFISNVIAETTRRKEGFKCNEKSYVCKTMKNPDPFYCDFSGVKKGSKKRSRNGGKALVKASGTALSDPGNFCIDNPGSCLIDPSGNKRLKGGFVIR